MIFSIPDDLRFPDPEESEASGLLGVGGDLRPERLLLAYSLGIFPWFSGDQPILWWSPDPRAILRPHELHVSRSLQKTLAQERFRVTLDTAFSEVVTNCAKAPRQGKPGTWITDEMCAAYTELHRQGFAHSVEVWSGDELVGGLYGVFVSGVFSGESMFAVQRDASKVALVRLVRQLEVWGVDVVDCQMRTDHLAHFGAVPIARRVFLEELQKGCRADPRQGRWSFDANVKTDGTPK